MKTLILIALMVFGAQMSACEKSIDYSEHCQQFCNGICGDDTFCCGHCLNRCKIHGG